MAANVLMKNKKMVEVLLRSSQRCNRSTVAGSNHELAFVVPSREYSSKESSGSSLTVPTKMNFSHLTGRASSAQPVSRSAVPQEFDQSNQEIWTQVFEKTFDPQLEKMFLLGNNAMITTYETDAAKIVYHGGKLEFALPSNLANVRCAARFADGSFVLCSTKDLTFFSSNCEYIASRKLATGHPYAMTVDNNGKIFVAMLGTNSITIYNQDGSFNKIFRTESSPLNLAVSKDRLVVAFVDGSVQLMDYKDPSSVTRLVQPTAISLNNWQPTRVCCNSNGDIFVLDWRQGAVYKYGADGDYQTRVCEGLRDPQDIAVSENGEELQVYESGLSAYVSSTQDPCVKTFRFVRWLITQLSELHPHSGELTRVWLRRLHFSWILINLVQRFIGFWKRDSISALVRTSC